MSKKKFSIIVPQKTKPKHLLKHETKRHVLIKFLLILTIFLSYLLFISMQYGLQQGIFVSALTWSFFVLCTPVADAGFLIDFPLRLVTKIKMIFTEILVWIMAITLNLYAFFFSSEIYTKTKVLILFKHILGNPFPFWIIILISLIGTFVSIKFGDELFDKVKHEDRTIYQKHKYNYRFIVMFFLFAIAFFLYDFLLKKLGINLPI